MPKVKMCRTPGCGLLADESGYCAKHQRFRVADAPKPRTPWDGANRPNRELYNTQRWKVLRDKVRKERGECVVCGSGDNLTVHHIVTPKGDEALFYDEGNLTVLCKACHDRQTSMENRR